MFVAECSEMKFVKQWKQICNMKDRTQITIANSYVGIWLQYNKKY